MFLLYNFLLTIGAIGWVPWMLWRTNRRKERPNWAQRQGALGVTPRKDRHRIWVHAVSVGEVVLSLPVLRELRLLLPNYEILMSVTTTSGYQTATEKTVGLVDHLVYFPIDVARFQLSAMQQAQPAVVAIVETELWFNFLWAAKAFSAKTMLINGRISDRSFPRALRIRPFYHALLSMMDVCLMQSEPDAERIRALGAREVRVLGNVKFDEAASVAADPVALRKDLRIPDGRPVVVIGSTRGEDEEELVLDALAEVGFDRITVVHAPRHLERVAALAEMIRRRTGAVALRSKHEGGPYLLLDTYGELNGVYSLADVAVVGGGFGDYGGQNLLQPLAHGKPVIHGPHMQNFKEAALEAGKAGATVVAKDAKELAGAIAEILGDRERAQMMGQAAREFIRGNLGAAKRYAQEIAAMAVQ